MGILDSLESSPAFKGALGQLGGAILPVVLSEVLGNGSQGGLNAIVAKLQQAGLGDQVKSWIGTARISRSPPNSCSRCWAATPSSSWPPASIFRSISSPRCWRSSFRWRWITPARTASCRIRPDWGGDGSRQRRVDSPGTRKAGLIALKNLQNSRICYVAM